MIRIALSLTAVALAACVSDSDPGPADVTGARQRWNASEPEYYSYTVFRSCFCIGPHAVRVLAGKDSVLSAVIGDAGPDSGKAAAGPQGYSIDSLIALAETELSLKTYTVHVHFDAKYGFPDTLDVDPEHHPVDGGYAIYVSGFRVEQLARIQ